MTTLKELIDSEPANAARTDQEVFDWCNELVSVVGSIASLSLIAWAAANGRFSAITAGTNHSDAGLASVAEAALVTIKRQDASLDMSDSTHEDLVDILVAGGVLSSTDKDELVALATTLVDRVTNAGVSRKNLGVSLVNSVRSA
jgi:hypothetical protein